MSERTWPGVYGSIILRKHVHIKIHNVSSVRRVLCKFILNFECARFSIANISKRIGRIPTNNYKCSGAFLKIKARPKSLQWKYQELQKSDAIIENPLTIMAKRKRERVYLARKVYILARPRTKKKLKCKLYNAAENENTKRAPRCARLQIFNCIRSGTRQNGANFKFL